MIFFDNALAPGKLSSWIPLRSEFWTPKWDPLQENVVTGPRFGPEHGADQRLIFAFPALPISVPFSDDLPSPSIVLNQTMMVHQTAQWRWVGPWPEKRPGFALRLQPVLRLKQARKAATLCMCVRASV